MALAAMALVVILGTPRLMELEPRPGSSFAPSTTSLRLTFNLPMDRNSVEARLSIEPAIPGELFWEGNSLRFVPNMPWPRGETVTVCIAAGARSIYFLPQIQRRCWSFGIGFPRLLFLAEVQGRAELHARGIDDDRDEILIQTPLGVLDYSISQSATGIVYSALREDGSSDLRLFDLLASEDRLLLTCPPGWLCQRPHLSPDLRFVAYERAPLEELRGGQSLIGSSQIWVAPIGDRGEPSRVSDDDHACESPLWSPSGYLAYSDHTAGQIVILRGREGLAFERVHFAPSELGVMGAWSPEGSYLLYPDLIITEATYDRHELTGDEFPLYYSHLMRYDLSLGLLSDLSGEGHGYVEDASPAFSPNGQWIAFTRKHLEIERWTPGRQVWMMRADGTNARPITSAPESGHFDLAWSHDSKYLSFVRNNQSDLLQPLETWIYDMERDEIMLVWIGGYHPQWLP